MLLVSFVHVVCNSHRDTKPCIESWFTNPEREKIYLKKQNKGSNCRTVNLSSLMK